MKILLLIFIQFLFFFKNNTSSAEGEVVMKEYFELMSKPLLLDGLMINRKDEAVVQVISSDRIDYYCKVDLEIHDFGLYLKLYNEMAEYNPLFGKAKDMMIITVLSPASKIRRDGIEGFEPLHFSISNKIRKYTLIYSPFLSINGATGLVIVDVTSH